MRSCLGVVELQEDLKHAVVDRVLGAEVFHELARLACREECEQPLDHLISVGFSLVKADSVFFSDAL